MENLQSNFSFKGMAVLFKIRDFFVPRIKVIREIGLKPGFQVLDYGCGPGGYILPVAEMVGELGKVYALDINPLAIQMVQNLAVNKHLKNVITIYSDCITGLPDNSIDVALLYDTFHDLENPDDVLNEIHRVLKPDGILSFNDHHMKTDEILSKVTNNGLFKLMKKGRRTYSFRKLYR